jgi:hypothetical protein
LLATDVVLTDGSSTSLAQQTEAAGANTLMMTGNPDRIIEFDGTEQPYLSKPFLSDLFVQPVREMLRQIEKTSSFEPAYFAGPDSPAVLFAAGSIVPNAVKAALIRPTSASDISSRLMKELRAAVLTRMSSSNLSCMAWVSRI